MSAPTVKNEPERPLIKARQPRGCQAALFYGDDPMKALALFYDRACMRKGHSSIFSFRSPTVVFQQRYPGDFPDV